MFSNNVPDQTLIGVDVAAISRRFSFRYRRGFRPSPPSRQYRHQAPGIRVRPCMLIRGSRAARADRSEGLCVFITRNWSTIMRSSAVARSNRQTSNYLCVGFTNQHLYAETAHWLAAQCVPVQLCRFAVSQANGKYGLARRRAIERMDSPMGRPLIGDPSAEAAVLKPPPTQNSPRPDERFGSPC